MNGCLKLSKFKTVYERIFPKQDTYLKHLCFATYSSYLTTVQLAAAVRIGKF